jgi:hypothetical protein
MDYQTIAALSLAALGAAAFGVFCLMFIINELMIDFPVKVGYNKYITWLVKHKE